MSFLILGVSQSTREASRGMDVTEDASARRDERKRRRDERRALMCKLEAIQEARRQGLTLWGKDW